MIKKIILLMVISFSFSKEHIAVIDFEAIGVKKSDAKALTQRITTELIKVDNYIVVERSQIDQMLKEQKFQYSGGSDISWAVDVGKILGAKYIVLGTVSRFGQTYTLDARLVDVESSQSMRSAAYTTSKQIDILLLEGVKSIVRQLVGDYEGQDDEILSSDKQENQKPDMSSYRSYFRIDTEISSNFEINSSSNAEVFANPNHKTSPLNGFNLSYEYAKPNAWGAGIEFQFLREMDGISTAIGDEAFDSSDFRFTSLYAIRNYTVDQLNLFIRVGLSFLYFEDPSDGEDFGSSWSMIGTGARYPVSDLMYFELGFSNYSSNENEAYSRIYMGLTFIF